VLGGVNKKKRNNSLFSQRGLVSALKFFDSEKEKMSQKVKKCFIQKLFWNFIGLKNL